MKLGIRNRRRMFAAALVAALGGSLLMSVARLHADQATPPPPPMNNPMRDLPIGVVPAYTKPSEESKATFNAPGVVRTVAVKEGDIVKEGQMMAQQDDRQDAAALKSLQLEANSQEKVKYSQADQDEKKLELDRKQEMLDKHVATLTEFQQADLEYKRAIAETNLAKLEHDQKGLEAEKQSVKVEQMKLVAPFDGVVTTINIAPGEMSDPQNRDGAIVVGKWDPLWVEMHLLTAQAAPLKVGQTLPVSYDGTKWESAKVIVMAPKDPKSGTQEVRLELANPSNEKPGAWVQVKLTETQTPVAESKP